MEILRYIIDQLTKFFTWWVSIQPWEQGLRVRLGKNERLLQPGFHFRIPIVDIIYVQTDRVRVVNIPVQTLTTKDNKTVTVTTAFRYSISNVRDLYHTLYVPEMTIANMVMSAVADYVATHDIAEATPSKIESNTSLDFSDKGISDIKISVVGYALVKTYRLISENGYMDPGFRTDEFSAKK